MKLKRILATLVLPVALMACTEQNKVTPYTYPQVFTGETEKVWTIRNIQFLQEGKGTQTFTLDPCATNDLYIFTNNAEKTYKVSEGATKCSPDDPDLIVDSNWGFNNASAQLTIIMPLLADVPLPFIVKEVDETKMVLDIYFDDNKSSYRFNFRSSSND